MFHILEKQIHAAFRHALRTRFELDPEFGLEQPRQSAFGEIAVPVAFQLAKTLRQPPKKAAEQLVEAVGQVPGVAAMEIAGNGYVNIRLDRGAYAFGLLAGAEETFPQTGAKIIVERLKEKFII